MNSREELENSIANLYVVFDRYPLRQYIEGCPCCINELDNLLIHSKSLKMLTTSDLDLFSFHAITTWGTVEDFKYFLPRILELLALQPHALLSSDLILRKLDYADWYNWPEIEKTAIVNYLIALWNYILSEFPAFYYALNANDFLVDLGVIFENLQLFLDIWRSQNSISAQLHLAHFIIDNDCQILRNR